MAEKKCKLCGKQPAVVPDRESMSPAKAVCRSCHGNRLLGDLRNIMAEAQERRKKS